MSVANKRRHPAVSNSTGEYHQGDRIGECIVDYLLARGGMGAVYKATRSGETVAVKVMDPNYKNSASMRQRFKLEADVLMALKHPNIVKGVEADPGAEFPYIIMEHIEGENPRSLSQRLSIHEKMMVAMDVCDALTYLHRFGLVHRDIKPENILVTGKPGSLGRSVVIDFGIVKMMDGYEPLGEELQGARAMMTRIGAIFGTPEYSPMEMLDGRGLADHRVDTYSLAVILYEMVCNRMPYTNVSPRHLVAEMLMGAPASPRVYDPGIPPGLDEIIMHGMSRTPEDRFSNASEMKKELKDVLYQPLVHVLEYVCQSIGL